MRMKKRRLRGAFRRKAGVTRSEAKRSRRSQKRSLKKSSEKLRRKKSLSTHLKPRSTMRRKMRTRKPSRLKRRLKSPTKKQLKKRSKSSSSKRKLFINKQRKQKTPKYAPKSKTAKKIRRRLTRAIREKAARKGFKLIKNIDADRALYEIDTALSRFISETASQLPFQWDIRTHFNRDGSVDGQARAHRLEAVEELRGGWNQAFKTLAEYSLWPRAVYQTEDNADDRTNGAFFFSVRWEFVPPDGADWKELDRRYERTKGGFATSTYYRFTDTAAQELVGHAPALTEALTQKHYSYDIYSITIRLHWSPDGEQPQWK